MQCGRDYIVGYVLVENPVFRDTMWELSEALGIHLLLGLTDIRDTPYRLSLNLLGICHGMQ